MIVRFNPSGTHVHKGYLKIRVDLYPETTDKTYPIHYVDHYDREPTQEELDNPALLALVPTHKELNPCLCHFIKVDPNISPTELATIAKGIFDTATKTEIDKLLSEDKRENIIKLQQLMSTKLGTGTKVEGAVDITLLNTSLSVLEVGV